MSKDDTNVVTEAATPSGIDLLERFMPTSSMPDVHRKRFAQQEAGKGQYLIALHGGVPVGYVLLRFAPPEGEAALAYPNSTFVEGLSVAAAWQRRGVATRLMERLEAISIERRQPAISLYVGVKNWAAQALYQSLGYAPSDLPPYHVTWPTRDEAGHITEDGELCSFWLKSLTE